MRNKGSNELYGASSYFSLKWVFRGSLIFDETTSALDNKTQKQISQALDSMGCTRIIIAHRLSTIRNCDRILVFDNGNVIEDGSYDELIEKKGYFAELVERQRINSDKPDLDQQN